MGSSYAEGIENLIFKRNLKKGINLYELLFFVLLNYVSMITMLM
jgi:hypothetical protein